MRRTAVAATVVLGFLLAVPAQADTYSWDSANYGWRSVANGHEYTSPSGMYAVTGGWDTPARAFSAAHGANGGGRGTLGYPTSPQTAQQVELSVAEGYGFDVDGAYQVFERGVVYGSRSTDYQGQIDYSTTATVKGGRSPFQSAHAATGGGGGFLGYPIDDEVRQAGSYWYQEFLAGVIYVSPAGAFPVYDV